MPSLTLRLPDGTSRTVQLIKRITTVGRSADNDVVIPDPSIPASALHLQLAGDACNVVALDADFFFNGRKKNEAILRAGDVLGIGDAELLLEEPKAQAIARGHSPEALAAFRQLHAFSERLLGDYEIEQVLENLMDAAIEVTNADKGFLILLEGNELRVKVARNLARQNIEDAIERVSDSIVAKVVKNKRPLIVSDALHDTEFNSAASVVNLKLCSVMCAPLMERGNLFGLIYVGNDKVVNLFE
jgi:hypothetical protein